MLDINLDLCLKVKPLYSPCILNAFLPLDFGGVCTLSSTMQNVIYGLDWELVQTEKIEEDPFNDKF